MSGISINDYREVVADLAEQIQKYGDARSAHDKSAEALYDLGIRFNKTAIALETQIEETVSALENAGAALSVSNTRASQLHDSLERSLASQIDSVDRLSARADDHHKSIELRFQELNSRLDMLNARVGQALFWLYGVVALLVLVLLLVILK